MRSRPDGQMVASFARQDASGARPVSAMLDVFGDDDAVEEQEGHRRVKARAAVRQWYGPCSKARSTPDLRLGFVEVAHQYGGHAASSACSSRTIGLCLQRAPFAREAQMHADDAEELAATTIEISDGGAARFEMGKDHRKRSGHRRWTCATRMTLPWWPRLCGRSAKADGAVVGFAFSIGLGVERGDARAEAAIDLLQRNDIGADFGQHLEHARGAAAPVEADGLADVVGRDGLSGGKRRKGLSAPTVGSRSARQSASAFRRTSGRVAGTLGVGFMLSMRTRAVSAACWSGDWVPSSA